MKTSILCNNLYEIQIFLPVIYLRNGPFQLTSIIQVISHIDCQTPTQFNVLISPNRFNSIGFRTKYLRTRTKLKQKALADCISVTKCHQNE